MLVAVWSGISRSTGSSGNRRRRSVLVVVLVVAAGKRRRRSRKCPRVTVSSGMVLVAVGLVVVPPVVRDTLE